MFYRSIFRLLAAAGVLTYAQIAAAQSAPQEDGWQRLEDYEGIQSAKPAPSSGLPRRGAENRGGQTSPDSGWIDLEEFTQNYEEQRSRRTAPNQNNQGQFNQGQNNQEQNNDEGWVPLETFIPGAQADESYRQRPSPPESGEWASLEEMFSASAAAPNLRTAPLVAGDSIFIEFNGIEDMSGLYKVSDIGTVDMPLIGNIRAAGMITTQLEDTLEQMYGKDYLNNPKIKAALQPRPLGDVSLKGLVNLPGDYAMTEKMTLAEALAKGAGATGLAFGRDAVISRRRGNRVWVRRVALDNIRRGAETGPDILPGDLVNVVDRRAMPPLKELNAREFPLLSNVLKVGAEINF